MTEMFVSAAELMARVLGADGYPFVTIGHPISSASTDVLAEWARVAAGQVNSLATAPPSGAGGSASTGSD